MGHNDCESWPVSASERDHPSIHPSIHPYIHTYIHKYHYITFTLNYITLHCITLRYITLHYIHTYVHTYIHTYLHTCMHAYIHTHLEDTSQGDHPAQLCMGSTAQESASTPIPNLLDNVTEQDRKRITVLYISRNTRISEAPGNEPQLRRRQRDAALTAWERANAA